MGFLDLGAIRLEGHGEFGQTISAVGAVPRDADIESYKGKLSYDLSEAWKTYVSYEEFRLRSPLAGGGNLVRQRWASVGLGTRLGETGTLNLAYEYGAVHNNIGWGTGPSGRFSGGFLTTQLSIRF